MTNLRHVAMGLGLLVVAAWVSAHLAVLALGAWSVRTLREVAVL
jgi:hypothetical protein